MVWSSFPFLKSPLGSESAFAVDTRALTQRTSPHQLAAPDPAPPAWRRLGHPGAGRGARLSVTWVCGGAGAEPQPTPTATPQASQGSSADILVAQVSHMVEPGLTGVRSTLFPWEKARVCCLLGGVRTARPSVQPLLTRVVKAPVKARCFPGRGFPHPEGRAHGRVSRGPSRRTVTGRSMPDFSM